MKTPPPLDKAGEVAALDTFRASLPPDSYLAAWIAYAGPHIAADIRNDIFPTFRPDECRAAMLAEMTAAANARKDAHADAARILDQARAAALTITADAKRAAKHTADAIARDIIEAQHAARRFIQAAEEIHRNGPTTNAATATPNS